VTSYAPGKKIEVLTGDKRSHSFNLEEKGVQASVNGPVAVGSRVTLVDEKGDKTPHRITVNVEG
jgi:hypothetical protein